MASHPVRKISVVPPYSLFLRPRRLWPRLLPPWRCWSARLFCPRSPIPPIAAVGADHTACRQRSTRRFILVVRIRNGFLLLPLPPPPLPLFGLPCCTQTKTGMPQNNHTVREKPMVKEVGRETTTKSSRKECLCTRAPPSPQCHGITLVRRRIRYFPSVSTRNRRHRISSMPRTGMLVFLQPALPWKVCGERKQ